MAGFTESSITLDFSTEHWFRFEKSSPYDKLSGFHFKEMDACWVKDMGTSNAEFYAVELKDYSAGNLKETSSDRVWDIVKKVVDTIQMFMSARYQNGFGKQLEAEKSVDLHNGIQKAVFLTIVNFKAEDAQMFQTMKDECLLKLKGYSSVWDGIEIHVLPIPAAQKYFGEFVK